RIEDGKLGRPLKGAMLIGNGPTDLNRISMIGNDFELDPGIGTCGKNGQGVPVGVGQPTLRMDRITVGGTALSLEVRDAPPAGGHRETDAERQQTCEFGRSR